MLIHWIWLALRHSVSDRARKSLLEQFRDPEDIFFADSDAFEHVGELSEEGKDSLRDKSLVSAQKILDQCTRGNIHILTYRDAAYPARLRNIPDPPMVLYYKGNLPDFDGSPLIGVVGTRKASAYGLGVAKRMGYQIAKCGGTVVSGMAFGIDGAAMQAALTAGGTVVGVLGCGADVVYPVSNRGLFADTEKYGCLISEFPPGTPPNGRNFPKRNRIISGVSCGVLVIEAPEKSGSLITARQAVDQGRDLFAVPGNIDVPSFEGSNRLIREGAILVTSGWDVISEYEALFPDKIHREDAPARQAGYPDEVERIEAESGKLKLRVAQKPKVPAKNTAPEPENAKLAIDNGDCAPYSDVINKQKLTLSETERAIVDALGSEPRLVDDVIAGTALSAAKVLPALTILEIRGIVKRHPGKRVSLKTGN